MRITKLVLLLLLGNLAVGQELRDAVCIPQSIADYMHTYHPSDAVKPVCVVPETKHDFHPTEPSEHKPNRFLAAIKRHPKVFLGLSMAGGGIGGWAWKNTQNPGSCPSTINGYHYSGTPGPNGCPNPKTYWPK